MDADRSILMVHARADELEETAMNEGGGRCPLSGSGKQPGATTFAVDLTFGVVVVRHVPASICTQCGDAWIGGSVAVKLESIVAEERRKQALVEVTQWKHVV